MFKSHHQWLGFQWKFNGVWNLQKVSFALFLPLWSFKNAFLWLLNEPSWPGYIAKCCKSLRTNTICNANSIQQTKPKKTTKNLLFGTLDHSKMHFPDFSMILHDLAVLLIVGKHLVPSKYAISSRTNRPNSRKWPKTSFLALWLIQKCFLETFEWSFMTW